MKFSEFFVRAMAVGEICPVFQITDQYGETFTPTDMEWCVEPSDDVTVHAAGQMSFGRAVKYRLTVRSRRYGAEGSATLVVTPPMLSVSVGAVACASSAENVGTLPSGAVDGDRSTRWGECAYHTLRRRVSMSSFQAGSRARWRSADRFSFLLYDRRHPEYHSFRMA